MSSTKSHTAFSQQSSLSLSNNSPFHHDFSGTTTSSSSHNSSSHNTTNPKKKFGKNLNKQHKQPAPPITLGVSASGASRSASSSSSRSGLLLLSTTKKSSTGSSLLGSKLSSNARAAIPSSTGETPNPRTSGTGTNAVATFHAPPPSSTNDALLDAAAAEAAGGNGIYKSKETTPLAWGLTEKRVEPPKPSVKDALHGGVGGLTVPLPKPAVTKFSSSRMDTSNVGAGGLSVKSTRIGTMELYPNNLDHRTRTRDDGSLTDVVNPHEPIPIPNPEPSPSSTTNDTHPKQLYTVRRTPSHDTTTDVEHEPGSLPTENQEVYMAKLAREAAEKRRREEEARVRDQKERAALRLRELERKTGNRSAPNVGSVGTSTLLHPSSEAVRWRQPSSGPSCEVVLERLGSTKGNGNVRGLSGGDTMADVKRAPRKLFDPNRSYSSLVGGSKNPKSSMTSEGEATYIKTNVEDPKEVYNNSLPQEADAADSNVRPPNDSAASPPAPSMIQLSSYEDRDRGARKPNSGPRMLFDPKSGSMVAAPRRDENGAFGKGRKDKIKTKARNGKERDDSALSQVSSKRPTLTNNAYGRFSSDDTSNLDDGTDTKQQKFRNCRRDDISSRKEKKRSDKEKKISDSARSSGFENANRSRTRTSANKNDCAHTNQQRTRMPRTKGVLYKRDEYGHLVSADKCEGDQGYGAHSVPGGRLRNVKAFKNFVKRQQRDTHATITDGDSSSYFPTHQQQGYPNIGSKMILDYETNGHRSNLGLNRSHFMKPHSPHSSPTPVQTKPEIDLDLPSPLRVKPNEKIELLTGVEDSPTLQATAAAWAPSEAALAAAAAAKSTENSGIDISSHDSDVMSDSEVHRNAMALIDHDIASEESVTTSLKYGLGFDPTENMDSVILTPATGSGGNPEGIHLPELDLDASHVGTEERSLSNPFGGLGPSLGCPTWGTGSSNMPIGPLSNWDLLGSGNKQNVAVPGSPTEHNECTAASFLSLGNLSGNQNTWGTGGLVSGFTTLAGTPLGRVEAQLSVDKN